jgi:subtilisin family serine protease
MYFMNNQASLHPNATYPFADINCESAWNRETGKPYVKVGIYDTGMDWNNSDLNGIMAGGFDFVYNTNITSIDNGPSNHGTSCGGIIGAKRNNGIGVAGIAGGDYGISSPGVNLYTMRIGDTTLLTMSAIAPAIVQGALSQSANGFDLNVMNASWGSSTGYYDRALMDAINISNQNGVAFVASRGNDNSPNPHTPATLKEQIIMSIGATGIDGHFKDGANGTDPTTFASSYGSPLDFMAPGTSALVYTTRAGGNNFFNFYGTSASAPIVSGVTALMMSYYNQPTPNWDNLTHEDCEAILKRTCNDLTNPFYGESIGYDQKTGHGRVDVADI